MREEIIAVGAGFLVCAVLIWAVNRRSAHKSMGLPAKPAAAAPPRKPWAQSGVQQLFTPGATFEYRGEPVAVEVRRIAELFLPSGRIVACDPLVYPESEPFSRSVPPGTYPVEVALARFSYGDERIAAARVVFREGTPSQYVLASEGPLPENLKPGEFVGYGVDAGVGCFMDAEAGRLLTRAAEALVNAPDSSDDALLRELQGPSGETKEWVDHRPDPSRSENVVVIHSGWGDGFYPSVWALDAEGVPLWLATDFLVLT